MLTARRMLLTLRPRNRPSTPERVILNTNRPAPRLAFVEDWGT
jgi:hypothetical protein